MLCALRSRSAAGRDPGRGSGCIRAWRSDAVRTAERLSALLAACEQVFPDVQGGARRRLARQLRRERVLGAGHGMGYDLARHAALVRALAEWRSGKPKAPRA